MSDEIQNIFLKRDLSRTDVSYTNEHEIRLVGLARSGNHAIINWIIQQLDGDYCFLNCTEPKTNPFTTARPMNPAGDYLKTNIPHFNITDELQGKFSYKDYLIYSHEDCYLGPLNHRSFIANSRQWVGTSRRTKNILIMRDVFNLFASRIRAGLLFGHETHFGVKPISYHVLLSIYKQHAKEYLHIKNNLKHKLCINYNQWIKDREYRKAIANELGLEFTDRGLDEVSECAGGSSFDNLTFFDSSSKMKLDERWKYYISSPDYWNLFDEETVEYTRLIFGDIPPVIFWDQQVNTRAS